MPADVPPSNPGSADSPPSAVDSLLRDVAAAPATSPPPTLEPGTVIAGAFRVERRLGAGGMGVVYLCRDLRLGREVALKLHRDSPDAGAERALAEAKVLARFAHPNVVTVYEVGTHEGRLFIAMQHVSGGTLRAWLADQRRRWSEVLDRFLDAGRGLAAAHAAGMVHRDFKPDNVLLEASRVCVADFGLARPTTGDDARAAARGEPVAGTPAYIAPEQRRGEPASERSDQYAFCLAMKQALADRPAPRWLRRAITRGVDEDPARRHESMSALIARLEAGRRRRRWQIAAAAALILAGALGATWLARRPAALCQGSADRLAGAWDDTRQGRVTAALAAAGAPAPQAAAVLAGLDRYASAWVAMHHEACAATRIHGDQSERLLEARMACLDRARAQFGATTTLLSQPTAHATTPAAGAATADVARDAVTALPPLARCANLTVLAGQPPLPTDPAGHRAASEISEMLAMMNALRALGRQPEALPLALVAAARAAAADYTPLRIDTLRALATLSQEMGLPSAEARYRAALDLALSSSDLSSAAWFLAELAAHLASRGRVAEGLELAGLADATRRGADGGAQLEWLVTANLPSVYSDAERFAEAEAFARRNVELQRGREDVDIRDLALALIQLGQVHLDAHHPEQAVAPLEEALAAMDRDRGPDHQVTLHAVVVLAQVRIAQGDLAAAEAGLRRVVEAQTRRLGRDDPRRVNALTNLGGVLQMRGDLDGAVASLEEALRLLGQGAPSLAMGETLGNVAIVHAMSGRMDAALDYARRSLDAFRQTVGERSPKLVHPAATLGTIARMAGRLDEAAPAHELANDLALALSQDDPARVNAAVELALTRLAQHRPTDAVTLLEPAVDAWQRLGVVPNLAEARFALARGLWEANGDRRRARALAVEARNAYATLGAAEQAAEIDAWLGTHR